MPIIRRSNRIQAKNTSQKIKQEDRKAHEIVTKPIKSKTVVKSESPKLCSGCNDTHPPIRRYNVVQWVQCENCDSWWHAECVCINPEDILKLDLYEIPYTCVLCVLQGSPWIVENNKINVTVTPVKDKISKLNRESDIKQKSNTDRDNSKEQKPTPSKSCTENKHQVSGRPVQQGSETVSNSNNIVVVDNIEEAHQFKSSKSIRDNLSRHPELQEVEFAYSLPKGGVALHFKSEEKANNILENWPGSVFSQSEKPHRIRGKGSVQIGFVKNIDLKLTDNQLKSFLESSGCKVKEVSKVFHRHSGKPMPIRKVTFESESDLEEAIRLEFPYKINGKQAFCEKEKQFKVVRCFSCHRYNHIAANCPYKNTCENCGSEEHIYTECQKQSRCKNCGGNHKSSSNSCPEYLAIIQRIRKNQLF